MRRILEATLELDAESRLQRTEIVREILDTGEVTREIRIERPLTLEDFGHEMVLER